jgi:hypothetical protein
MIFNYPESCSTDQQKIEFLQNLITNKEFANDEELLAIRQALKAFLGNS